MYQPYKTLLIPLTLCFATTFIGALPATHAYLSVPHLNELVQESWQEELVKYQDIINQALDKELMYHDTHHVFYHAQRADFRIIQDFIKEMYTFLYPTVPVDDFYFLRPWFEFPLTIDAQTFINEQEKCGIKEWCDNRSFFVKNMLSVNFSFFGSTKNYGVFGECTFKYFFMNKSVKSPEIALLLKNLFNHFDLDETYINDLLILNSRIATKEGSLFQIFVPKDKVDQIAFAAQRLGTPLRTPVVANYFDYGLKRHTVLKPLLDTYCSSPSAIDHILDRLQGRLLFSQDILLNPISGVRIYRYTTIDPYQLHDYHTDVKNLAHKVLKRWLKKIIKKKKQVVYPINYGMAVSLGEYYASKN